eukprot:1152649-Pelagomonas_calceolata.AAC.1
MPCVSTNMKHTIFQYRTGTLYNQKHAVLRLVHPSGLAVLLGMVLGEDKYVDAAAHSNKQFWLEILAC